MRKSFIINVDCIGFEKPIKLSSSQKISWYANLRELQSNFLRVEKFSELIKDFLVSEGSTIVNS